MQQIYDITKFWERPEMTKPKMGRPVTTGKGVLIAVRILPDLRGIPQHSRQSGKALSAR